MTNVEDLTIWDEEQDRMIRLLAARHRVPESAALPTSPVATELFQTITRSAEPDAPPAAESRRRVSWWPRRRIAIAVPVAVVVAFLAVLVTAALPTGGPVGPSPADALEVSHGEDYLTITIADPAASPERYNAELAELGFDIELSLAPARPEDVGRAVFMEVGNTEGGPTVEVVEAPGQCAGDGECSVQIRIPADFGSYARIVLGRTPLPDETFEGDAPVLTAEEQELISGMVGKRVSDVRATLAAQGWTAEYRVGRRELAAQEDEVPDDWYVYDVAPLSGGVVVLVVSETGEAP